MEKVASIATMYIKWVERSDWLRGMRRTPVLGLDEGIIENQEKREWLLGRAFVIDTFSLKCWGHIQIISRTWMDVQV